MYVWGEGLSFRIGRCGWALALTALLAACLPTVDRTTLQHDGVVERMAVSAPAVARSGAPFCGDTRLAAGVKGGSGGGAGFTPTVG